MEHSFWFLLTMLIYCK